MPNIEHSVISQVAPSMGTPRNIKLHAVNGTDSQYQAEDGRSMSREYGETPNGNPLGGRWVLRSPTEEFLDFDQYRHDLAERNNLCLAD